MELYAYSFEWGPGRDCLEFEYDKFKAVNPAFTTYRTLENGTVNPIAGNAVPVGSEPILLVANKKH